MSRDRVENASHGLRRDKIEIVRDVLDLCVSPRKITQILRLANLQFNSFHRFIDPLVFDGYMIEIPPQKAKGKTSWMTTANGRLLYADINTILEKVKI